MGKNVKRMIFQSIAPFLRLFKFWRSCFILKCSTTWYFLKAKIVFLWSYHHPSQNLFPQMHVCLFCSANSIRNCHLGSAVVIRLRDLISALPNVSTTPKNISTTCDMQESIFHFPSSTRDECCDNGDGGSTLQWPQHEGWQQSPLQKRPIPWVLEMLVPDKTQEFPIHQLRSSASFPSSVLV